MKKLDKSLLYIVAVSTGVDSMVLLDMLIKNEIKIVVCHVNHNKREQSVIEEEFIKKYCNNRNIPIVVNSFNYTGDNFQNEARKYRYAFLIDTLKKYNADAILTAHHAVDNVESILMHMLRGSNLVGYSGINDLHNSQYPILRPLINYSKNDIIEYAKNNQVEYYDDDSNFTNDYLRNKIRNNIINEFELINENYYKKFLQYSSILKESFDFIRKTSISYIHNGVVKLEEYNNLDIAIKKDILNYLFDLNGVVSSLNKINDCVEMLESCKPNLEYHLTSEILLIKTYDSFYLRKKKNEIINESIQLEETKKIGNRLFYFTKEIPKTSANFIKVCYNIGDNHLVIRNRLPGDKIKIKTGHKKVSDYFKDKKIIKEEREKALLVVNNKNEVLWIVDHYKVESFGDYYLILLDGECNE